MLYKDPIICANLCYLSAKVFLQNEWSKKTELDWLIDGLIHRLTRQVLVCCMQLS